MAVRVLFCPICAERTPHEPRRAQALLAAASLIALALAALAWTRWVDAVSGTLALVVAIVLALRGIERRWQFVACMRCREHQRRSYRRTKPDPRNTLFGGG